MGVGQAIVRIERPEYDFNMTTLELNPPDLEKGAKEAVITHSRQTYGTPREEVEKTLRDKIGDDNTTIQFLMKGLQRDSTEKNFEWKFNLDALWNHYEDIMDGVTGNAPFTGPVLFIKGGKSDYINAGNYPDIADLFPNNQLIEIPDAGHWVQAEKPVEFVEIAEKFLLS